MKQPRRSGYLKDKLDRRDAKFGFASFYDTNKQKSSTNLWIPGMQLEHQDRGPGKRTSACTGYAGAYAARVAIKRHTKVDPGSMSPLYLYYTGRAVWDGEDRDQGSYIRTLFKAMQLQGACREKLFPQKLGVWRAPSWRQVKDGFKHRGLRNYREIKSEDDARAALSLGMPLVGGWACGREFWGWDGGSAHDRIEKDGGGHAMAVMGYNRKGEYLIPNSYGEDGGEDGWWRVSGKWLLSGGRLWAFDMRKR